MAIIYYLLLLLFELCRGFFKIMWLVGTSG